MFAEFDLRVVLGVSVEVELEAAIIGVVRSVFDGDKVYSCICAVPEEIKAPSPRSDRTRVKDFTRSVGGDQRVARDAKITLNDCPAVVVPVVEVIGPDRGSRTGVGY